MQENREEILAREGFYDRHRTAIRIFTAAVSFRVAIYILSVCVMAIFGNYPEGITFKDFLETWNRWDSPHYIDIAEKGYSGAIENGQHLFLVFYPLYPWLMRALSFLFGDMRLCGILVSTVCYGIGCVYFYKAAEGEIGREGAGYALLAISLFPFAFFWGAIVTESLFFAVASIFFCRLRQHRWVEVAFWGALACLTKVQGLLLAFAVLFEVFHAGRGIYLLRCRQWKKFLKRIMGPGIICSFMLTGFGIYLWINYSVEGDPLRFMYYQKEHWSQELCPIWQTFSYIKDNAVNGWNTSAGMSIWVPELVLFFVFIIGIIYGIRKRLRPMYLVYLLVFFLLTYSTSWLLSGGRYTLNALPLFMLEGKWLAEHKKASGAVLMLSGALMIVYQVGFYQWKQIM